LDRVLGYLAGLELDAILLVGDLSCARGALYDSQRRERYVGRVGQIFERVTARGVPVGYVPGNHDLPELDWSGNLDHGRTMQVAGFSITGIGGAGPARFGFPYEWTEEEIRTRTVPACDLLLTHCPPSDSLLGRTASGSDGGSLAIRERALRHHGVLACGHIHEAAGVERIGDCLCLNAGGLGQPHGRAGVGLIEGIDRVRYVDLDNGVSSVLER